MLLALICVIVFLTILALCSNDFAGFLGEHWKKGAAIAMIVLAVYTYNDLTASVDTKIYNQRDTLCVDEQKALDGMDRGFEARTENIKRLMGSSDQTVRDNATEKYKKLKADHVRQKNDFLGDGSACGTRTPAEVQAAEQRNASFTPSAAAAPPPAPSTPTSLKFEKRHGNGSWGEVPEADVSSTDPLGTWRVTFPGNRYAITNIQLGGNTLEFGAVSGNVRLHPKDTFPCGPEGGPRLNQSWIPSHDQFIVKDADAKLCELIVGFNGQNGSFVPALRPREHTGTNGSLVLSVNHRISPGSGDEAMYAAGQATAEFTIR